MKKYFFLLFLAFCSEQKRENLIITDTNYGNWFKDIRGKVHAKPQSAASDFLDIKGQDVDTLFVFLNSNHYLDIDAYDSLLKQIKANHYFLIMPDNNYFYPYQTVYGNILAERQNFTVYFCKYVTPQHNYDKWRTGKNIQVLQSLKDSINLLRIAQNEKKSIF